MPRTLVAFILLFLGAAVLRGLNLLNRSHAERLAGLVFSISLPATILVSLDRIEFTSTAWKLPLAASLVTLPMLVGAWQIAALLELPRATRGAFLLATGCINSIYFAYPTVLATLGETGLAQAILFDVGQTTITLTLLYAVALWHGPASARPEAALHRLLLAPPLWALSSILLLKLFGLRLPAWLFDLLLPVHFTTTPLASLVLGLSINLTAKSNLSLAAVGVVLRMGGGILLGFAAAELLGLAGVQRVVVILVAGMPSAVTAVIFAAEAGLDEELTASIVALSVVVGVLLLPFLPQFEQWLAS
ncbi:MAG TPA: AEC family transporter [Nitrospira sp.]|jgi:malate permease and related proteins|nr:AEC family transporter [Nitrospira sp.]